MTVAWFRFEFAAQPRREAELRYSYIVETALSDESTIKIRDQRGIFKMWMAVHFSLSSVFSCHLIFLKASLSTPIDW